MSRFFEVHGPFEIDPSALSDAEASFWSQTKQLQRLRDERGVFLWCIYARRKLHPTLIGEANGSFGSDVFKKERRQKARDVMRGRPSSRLVLFLLSTERPRGRPKEGDLYEVAQTLIGLDASHEGQLVHIDAGEAPDWSISGLIRTPKGRLSAASDALRSAFGLTDANLDVSMFESGTGGSAAAANKRAREAEGKRRRRAGA